MAEIGCEMTNKSAVLCATNFPPASGNSSSQENVDCFDDDTARMAKTIACLAILLLTVVVNSLVIYPVYKYKRMRKNINFFIVNMAISDILLASLTNLFIAEQMVSGAWNWKIQGMAGRMTCKLMNFMTTMLLLVSPLTLFFMTLERYRGVTSTTMRNTMSFRKRCMCLTMCWTIPSILYAVELFRVDLYLHNNIPYCIVTKNFEFLNYLIAIFTFYVCLYLTVFFFAFLTLRKLRMSEQSINVIESRQRKRRLNRIRGAVRMVMWSLCSFILLSTPYHVFVFFDKLHPERTPCKQRINLFFVLRYLISINSALSPCIYFIFIKDFRTFVRGVYQSKRKQGSQSKQLTELFPLSPMQNNILNRGKHSSPLLSKRT